MCILCIGIWTIWTENKSGKFTDAPPASLGISESELTKRSEKTLVYTKHARERMLQRGANDNEVEQTILTGEKLPAKNGKVKFERTYQKSCEFEGRTYSQKKVEVVTAPEENKWVIVTVIADCK
jgi:hypothetical protein